MRALAHIFSLATVAFSAMLLQACTTTDSSVGGSNQNNLNAECKPGDQKMAEDGCNTCACQQNGFWACTEKGCVDPGSCKPGETKKSNDGCNTCTCQQDGTWACSLKVCDKPCEGDPMPCTAPPPGCDYEGGGCVNGQWTCGTLVCNNACTSNADCPQPDSPCHNAVCEAGQCQLVTVPGCGVACAPQDAKGVGACEAFFGYAWNGKECVGLSGCSCEGKDCDNTYSSPEECKKAHAECGTGVECVVNSDCPAPPPVCHTCPDGTEICPSVACINGMCVMSSGDCAGGGIAPGLPCDKPGEKAPADDGCNTCVCGADGFWDCTKIACSEPCDGPIPPCAAPPPGCDYVGGGCVNGQWTCGTLVCSNECKPGEVKNAGDGCNTCVCGDDGTWACTEKACPPECAPQDAKGVGICDAYFGIVWNGEWCESVSGCSCEGNDCKNLYNSPEECEKVHASCKAPPLACKTDKDCPQPVDPPCLKCVGINTCPKNVCDMGTCVYVPPSCGDSCQPQDAKSDGGLCAAWFGYFWNGKECIGFSGCGCEGDDCGKAYPSKAICESIHTVCN